MDDFRHLFKHRLVVVDVVDSNNDLSRAAEWVRPTRRIIISGGDVEDVLRPPQPRRRTSAQLNDACTQKYESTFNTFA